MRASAAVLLALASLSPSEGAWWRDKWEDAKNAVSDTFDTAKETVQDTDWNDVVDTVNTAVDTVKDTAQDAGDWVADTDAGKAMINAGNQAKNKVNEGMDKAREGAEWVANTDAGKFMIDAGKRAAEYVIDCAQDIQGCKEEAAQKAAEYKGVAEEMAEMARQKALEAKEAMKNCAQDVQACKEDVKEAAQRAKEFSERQAERAKEFAEEAAEIAKQKALQAKDAIEERACPSGGAVGSKCTHVGMCSCKTGLQCVPGIQECREYGAPGDKCVAGSMRCRDDSYCWGTTCKAKGKTGEWCMPHTRCQEYCTKFLDSRKNYCAPWDGAPLDMHCRMDRQCSLSQNLWCNGGTITTWGKCSRCPHFCKPGEGCHSCDQDPTKIKCGRMTNKQAFACVFEQTADVVSDLVGCLFGVDIECGIAFAKQTARCVADPMSKASCEFKVGCADKYVVAKEYTKKWYARPAWITISGKVGGTAYPNIKLNPAFGYVDIDFEWKGEISAFIKAELEKKEGKYSVAKPLGSPISIFSKFFIAYYMPIMVEVKVQPFFWGSLNAYAGGTDGKSNAEVMLGVKWTNWAKLKMHLDIKSLSAQILEKGAGVGDGNINFLANGKVSVNMAGYIGLRMSVEVNKVGASLDLAGALKVDANVEAKIGNGDGYTPGNWKDMIGNIVTGKDVCIKGGVKVAAGVAVRTNIGFSIPNPKEAARAVCNWNLKNPGASKEDQAKCAKYMPEKMPWADMCNKLVDRMPKELDQIHDALRLLSKWNFYGAQTELKIPKVGRCWGAAKPEMTIKNEKADDTLAPATETISEHSLDHATILAKNLCIGSKGDSYATFGIPRGVTSVDDILLVHKSGAVSCTRNGGGTKFGCNNDERIAIFITDEQNNVVVPDGHHDGEFYFVDGFKGDSPTLVFQDEVKWNGGWWYRVWYGEDLYNVSEGDNTDWKTCFDVYATGVEGMPVGDKMPMDCMHTECDYKAGRCEWCDMGEFEGYCCKRGAPGCPNKSIGTKNYYSCVAKEERRWRSDKWYFSKLDDGSRIKLGPIDVGSTPLGKDRSIEEFITESLENKGAAEVALIAAAVLLIALLATFAFKAGYCFKGRNADMEFKPLLAV